ncbi:MAG: zinc ribbon domain-containing protein [Candidatus Eisenbacteria bacterium]
MSVWLDVYDQPSSGGKIVGTLPPGSLVVINVRYGTDPIYVGAPAGWAYGTSEDGRITGWVDTNLLTVTRPEHYIPVGSPDSAHQKRNESVLSRTSGMLALIPAAVALAIVLLLGIFYLFLVSDARAAAISSVAISLFGALNILFGVCAALSLVPHFHWDIMREIRLLYPVNYTLIAVDIVSAIWLLVSGIGLLRATAWSRRATMAYGCAAILDVALFLAGATPFGYLLTSFPTIYLATGAAKPWGAAASLVYPILLIVFMKKRQVRVAFENSRPDQRTGVRGQTSAFLPPHQIAEASATRVGPTEGSGSTCADLYCPSCGNSVKRGAVICIHCGVPNRAAYFRGYPVEKKKDTAMLLGVFLGFWTWLYTYKRDAWKFWLCLGLGLPTFGVSVVVGHIWAIINQAVRPNSFFRDYPNG